eukprot:8313621-Alexandrium_andersonii.AAC.1
MVSQWRGLRGSEKVLAIVTTKAAFGSQSTLRRQGSTSWQHLSVLREHLYKQIRLRKGGSSGMTAW